MIGVRGLLRVGMTVLTAGGLTLGTCGTAVADPTPYPHDRPLPAEASSPPVDSRAPYTPLVKRLLRQLLPTDHPSVSQLTNAAKLLHGLNVVPYLSKQSKCGTIGSNDAPSGTHPAIAPLCWADAQGVNVEAGGQVRQTTAPPNRTAMASSWDPRLLNAWGQVEGSEARALGITGLYAPQADLIRVPDWGRNLTVYGEDPLQAGTLAAAEVNGLQGKGAMAQVKHFAFYDGELQLLDSRVQDQAAHQIFLTPYEYAMTGSGVLPHPGHAASAMCSYARYELVRTPGMQGAPPSENPPLGSLACDNPLMNRVAHGQWKWPGFFASDYGLAMDSTIQSINAGNDQEMPTGIFFGPALVAAVSSGAVSLDTFKDSLARILYQEQRFHLLGHPDDDTDYLSPSSPANPLTPHAIPAAVKAAHGAITERAAEEGAVLLKNQNNALPLTKRALRGGVLVVGESAEYMPADPGPEQADGYPDRDAVSPLEQLREFAPRGSKITYLPYMPGKAPAVGDGMAVSRFSLASRTGKLGAGLTRVGGPGAGRVDPGIDFTATSGRGQLRFGRTYRWAGSVFVPQPDDYTFNFQFSVHDFAMLQPSGNAAGNIVPPSCSGPNAPVFTLQVTGAAQRAQTLTSSPDALSTIQTNPTASGFTERGLANCLVHVGALSPGRHPLTITWSTPKSFARDRFSMREPGSKAPSLRFAWTRPAADEAHAIAAAKQAHAVVVFADCKCVSENTPLTPRGVNALDGGPTHLINDMAKANRHTVVVSNVNVATLMPWLSRVRAVLQMWYPGSEGGTATARLLLGKAVPGGHLTSTWPRANQTVYSYDQKVPLYPGDTAGVHPERFDLGGATVDWTEGIFTGYRFFDRENITPLFAFGHGLSYTAFRYRHVTTHRSGAGIDVTFDVTNTGRRAGSAVPQIYVGPTRDVPVGVQQAQRALVGYDRIVIRPGHTRHEVIHLGPGKEKDGYGDRRAFQYWDSASQRFLTAPGSRRVWVGDSDVASHLIGAELFVPGTPSVATGTIPTVTPLSNIGLSNPASSSAESRSTWTAGPLAVVAAAFVLLRRRRQLFRRNDLALRASTTREHHFPSHCADLRGSPAV